MKTLILTLVAVFVLSSVAFSATVDERDDRPLGIGLDTIVYESDTALETVTVETKYDTENEETSVYLVGTVNLFQFIKSGNTAVE